MPQSPNSRRSFLLGGLAAASAGLVAAGCDGTAPSKEVTPIPAEDPAVKAKDSMDFYKNNMLKKGAAKK